MGAPPELKQYRELISLVDERYAIDQRLGRRLGRPLSPPPEVDAVLSEYTDVIRTYVIELIAYGGASGTRRAYDLLTELRPEYDRGRSFTARERAHAYSLIFKPDELYAFLMGDPVPGKKSKYVRALPVAEVVTGSPSEAPPTVEQKPAPFTISAPVAPKRRAVQVQTFEPLTYADDLPPSVYQAHTFVDLLRQAVYYRTSQFPDDTRRILRREHVEKLKTGKYTPEFVTELARSLRGNPERFLEKARASSQHEESPKPKRYIRKDLLDEPRNDGADRDAEPVDEDAVIDNTLRKRLE